MTYNLKATERGIELFTTLRNTYFEISKLAGECGELEAARIYGKKAEKADVHLYKMKQERQFMLKIEEQLQKIKVEK